MGPEKAQIGRGRFHGTLNGGKTIPLAWDILEFWETFFKGNGI
jgi:hypothetical protein